MEKKPSLLSRIFAQVAVSMLQNDSHVHNRIVIPRSEVIDNKIKASYVIKKGHKLFKMRFDGSDLTEMDVNMIGRNDLGNYKLNIEEGWLYVTALNKKNAIKWYNKNAGKIPT